MLCYIIHDMLCYITHDLIRYITHYMLCYITHDLLCYITNDLTCYITRDLICYITHDLICYITHVLICYKTHDKLCYITHDLLCYITNDLICYITHDMIWYDMLYNTWRTFFFHEGWTMVFKVVGGQPGPAGYISQLWTSADSLNEDVTNVLGIRRSFPIPYKNRLVSSWQTTKPKEVRHIEISKADRTTWKLTLHDINTTPIEPDWSGVVLSRPLTAVSLCFDFYRCCVYVSQSKFSLAEFSVLLGNFFADQVLLWILRSAAYSFAVHSFMPIVNLRNRTEEQRRRQTLCHKRDNDLVWKKLASNFTFL